MSDTLTLEPVTDTSAHPVTLTPAAVAQVKRLRAKKGNDGLHLRVGVKGGGCSGLSYVLALEDAPRATDAVYDVDGVTVLVDPKSAQFIQGMTLDYSTANLLEGGWKYLNPNVQKSCGCGTSFTPK
jgi:iron-sulfur cluster assembly protein